MTYNWKLPAFFGCSCGQYGKDRFVLFCCLCIKGEVERPLQSRDCAGRVPLTLGHFIHRNFQADGRFGGLDFIFDCLGFGKTSIFTAHVCWSAGKGAQEWLQLDPRPGWACLFSDCEGGMVFRGEGWSMWRKASLGTGIHGSIAFPALGSGGSLARRATRLPSFQAPGRKPTKERKRNYIYLI